MRTGTLSVRIFIFLFFISNSVFAASLNVDSYFKDKSACFILFDLTHHQRITEYNPNRCKEEISPDSTFKIPLSLMAFDQGLINQKTIFKWEGVQREFAAWNQDQTPQSWFANSTVWVSQSLTKQLGIKKIEFYLKKLNYGNQDFLGDPGKQNGLTGAWIDSSLKISAEQQLAFLTGLINEKLPISKNAMIATKENMYIETLPSGFKLYGKTGSGRKNPRTDMAYEGWFVGFLQKEKQTYVFILNFSDVKKENTNKMAGPRAKEIAKQLFPLLM